jgi:putative YjhG/YagF family dehydratase
MDDLYEIRTQSSGPAGSLPLTDEMLRNWASGDLFGLSQDAGMGWDPDELGGDEYLILSTAGGLRADDGSPIALGYHTGHWEVGLLVREAALEFRELKAIPFAGAVTDPCDGRTQGTPGMMDSLPYRNDAAIVLRRLIRSLPRRKGVVGVATCDKGLPAMMLALASMRDLPTVIVPGGVTLPPEEGEDAGKIQSIGSRFSHGMLTLQQAAELGCRACASPGGGCQFLGTAATAQVVAEAMGLAPIHSALAPSGQPIWMDIARRAARHVSEMNAKGVATKDIVTPASIRNAMIMHAAFGGSTNLLLHIPAIAHAAGLPRPTVEDWIEINRSTPRIVDALPNGPIGHVTVKVFLAGGVPEAMLHLRELGLIDESCLTVSGGTWKELLDEWATSERRERLRMRLRQDGVDPDDVIMSPARAKEKGLESTMTFPRGNIAPHGSVIKSTAIDPTVVDQDGVYRHTGLARVFTREAEAVEAVKNGTIQPGDVVVVICAGPMGAGMEETYQLTAALKHIPWGKQVAVITDARFSGVSTGACIGHVGPEALAGGPIGKLLDGDLIRIEIDRKNLVGSLDFVGRSGDLSPEHGSELLAKRSLRSDLSPRDDLPDDTRLWAALQAASGGTWGGCVYDAAAICNRLQTPS